MTQEFVPHTGFLRSEDVVSGVPLKQSEITQFINTMDAEVFKKDEEASRREKSPFQPKSLLDLAREATARMAEEAAQKEPAPIVAPEPTSPEPEAEIAASSEAPEPTDLAPEPPYEDAPEDEAAQAPVAMQADEEPLEQERVSPNSSVSEAAIQQAYEAGLADGQQQARDEVEAMMAQALSLLEQTVGAFEASAHSASETLAQTIEASVISLATARAGVEIDALPELFLARIETLAERVHASVSHPVVRLHPNDLLVLKPILEESENLLGLRLVPNAELQRGDIDIALEGIRLTDVLPRIEPKTTRVEYIPLVSAAEIAEQPEPQEQMHDLSLAEEPSEEENNVDSLSSAEQNLEAAPDLSNINGDDEQ